ncbi:MAG: 3-oxoacyl-ACP reductase FabG [Deltaproteobacteria bacterium]|nr:MAG: 3-oxoacyl-ACP reductase FabG [Deltaproteobacteria bacterium]
MELEGKVALVTGAGAGIGRAIVLAMANEGAAVVVNDVVNEKAEQVTREILDKEGRAVACVADVATSEGAEEVVQCAVKTFSRLDILVNNVGIVHKYTWFWEFTEEDYDLILKVNLKSAFLCSKAAAKVMIPQKYGRIINISSNAGRYGNPRLAAYSAAKAGIIALTKSCARELGPYNILVNVITPVAATPGLTPIPEEAHKQFVASLVLGREAQPEEVAPMVVFVASDKASYSTGQIFDASGGRYM